MSDSHTINGGAGECETPGEPPSEIVIESVKPSHTPPQIVKKFMARAEIICPMTGQVRVECVVCDEDWVFRNFIMEAR